MTTRTDIAADLVRTPRNVEVDQPSVEMTMQDYVDTLRVLESAFSAMSFPHLIDASGKQPLGGGVFVGITVSELDLKLSFAARTGPAQTGTVTTGSSAPVIEGEYSFIDTGATFETNSVARGSLVINYTDQSVADVIEVVSETELITKILVDGIGNTFDISDVYKVYNIVQCTALGGNIVGFDDLDVLTNAILPTAFTQVIIAASTSASIVETLDTGNLLTKGFFLGTKDT